MKAINFKTFVAKAKKVVNSRNTLPVLDNVLIKDGFAIVSDLETFYKARIEGLDTSITTLIDFKDFSKLLDKLKDGEIYFEPFTKEVENVKRDGTKEMKTEYHVKINTSKGTFNFPSCDPTEYPKIENCTNQIDVLTSRDILLLKKAVAFALKDEIRPVMCQILVEQNNIVSTDSWVMFFKDRDNGPIIKSVFEEAYKIDKTIPALLDETSIYSVLRSDSTTGKNSDGKEYEIKGKFLSIKNETEEIIFRECEGRYPSYRSVIPAKESQTTTLRVSKKELIEKLEMCELSQNKSSELTKFTLGGGLGIFVVSCQDVDFGKSYNASIPATVDGQSLEIGFKNSLVQKALKAIDENELSFTFSDPTRATILNDHLLIMPMML